jgi:hypothetical protein
MREEKADSPRGGKKEEEEEKKNTQVDGIKKSEYSRKDIFFYPIFLLPGEIGETEGGDLREEVGKAYTECGSISVHARFGQISSYDETKPNRSQEQVRPLCSSSL